MHMTAFKWLAVGIVLTLGTMNARAQLGGGAVPAQEEAPVPEVVETEKPPQDEEPAPKSAENHVTDVTVYQGNALVTREVAVPEGKGVKEVVVTPLPSQTIDGSLYTEGGEAIHVLSTRYRSRAVKEDTRAEVRAKEEEIKTLQAEAQRIQKQIQISKQNSEFLQKLENFTAATMQGLAEKGMLNGETTIALSKYVIETRSTTGTSEVSDEQALQQNAEALAFAQRQLAELSAGSSRTEIDAVIVVDKAGAAAGSVRLHYLVNAATWRPQYRIRAETDQDPVSLEYLGAIEQQTGEDWNDVRVTLSTAQPSLNATVPDLTPLDLAVTEIEEGEEFSFDQPSGGGMGGMRGVMGGMAGMGSGGSLEQSLASQASNYRGQAQQALIGNDVKTGGEFLNQAAALDQTHELLAPGNEEKAKAAAGEAGAAPTVTHHLPGKLNIPSRRDPLLVEVARQDMKAEFFAKAVPVLSPRVYRMAKLANSGESVLLPGEATMYVGSDFVGRMTMPLVAVGEPFTVGFGVDPQLQVGRRLVKKSRSIQGGNQVHDYEFRITLRSFKKVPVQFQVWDRLPKADAENVAVSLSTTTTNLSTDTIYERTARADNILRWDVSVPPGLPVDQPKTITYEFKLEYAKGVMIRFFKTGGLMESPIGGLGGGGGFR
jgi:hypothetical protein